MAATPALMEPFFDVDKLSYEIFSILESKFLFGKLCPSESPPETPLNPSAIYPSSSSNGKVRILSIDAVPDCALTAAYLAIIESSLRQQSRNPAARIADFFDVAAGSGAGGVIAAMLFARGADGSPMFSAEEAFVFLAKNAPIFALRPKGLFRRMFRRKRGEAAFRRVVGDATLRDTVKPILVPCFDLSTRAPFLFSRADAVESDGFDFRISEICDATCAVSRTVQMRSIDGRTRIAAVGGGVAAANPTAAAITHVLHNKHEFPCVSGIQDLLVLSIAGEIGPPAVRSSPSTAEMLRIAASGMSDMVDQAIAMAYSRNRTINSSSYLRLEVHGAKSSNKPSIGDAKKIMETAKDLLAQRNVESVLFQGKRLSDETIAQKLDRFAGELINEHEQRKKSPIPTVIIKQTMAMTMTMTTTPRTSSSTAITNSAATSCSP